MHLKLNQNEWGCYLEGDAGKLFITDEQDAVDVVGFCGEHRAAGVLLYPDNFPADFYDLKTGLAGRVLQKFVTYGVRVATVMEASALGSGRFGEMALEANRGGPFRFFETKEAAESWLLNKRRS